MKTEFNSRNTIAFFNNLNQGELELTWYWCTIFAPVINLRYNCWIKLTIEDIKKIWNKQIKLWLLTDKFWGKGSDWIKAVYQYVKDNADKRGWKIPNLIELNKYDNEKVLEWADRGYMILLGIKVNKNFPRDVIDWRLDLFEDYFKYKWNDLAHFTNFTKWKDRFLWSKWPKYNQEQFVDSYVFNKRWNKWIYECDMKKVLESFDMDTKYIFY